MARIRRSKTNTKFFLDIPKEHELNDDEKLERKYKKTLMGKGVDANDTHY